MKKKYLSVLLLVGLLSYSLPVIAAPKIYDNKEVFDAEYYAANNPDVVAGLGTDENTLLHHYVNYGKAEGRLGIDPNSNIYTKVVTPSAEALAKIADTSGDKLGVDYVYDEYKDVQLIAYHLGNSIYSDPKALHRTDFPDGLIDFDGNGIDDRDPINSMNVVDLNTNGVDDRSWLPMFDGTSNLYLDATTKNGDCLYTIIYLCEKHGVVVSPPFSEAIENGSNEGENVCAGCIAEKEAEEAARKAKIKTDREKKLAIHDSKYSIGYQMQNAEETHTFTYIGNMKWQRDDGTIWNGHIDDNGEFRGWRKWDFE